MSAYVDGEMSATVPQQDLFGLRWRSVRLRLTVVGVATLFVALAVAGGLVLIVVYRSLTDAADEATSTRSQEIVDALARGGIGAVPPTELEPTDSIGVVQVLARDGTVLAASHERQRVRPLVTPVDAGVRRTVNDATFPGDGTEFRAVVRGVTTPDGTVLNVVVGAGEGHLHATLWTVFGVLCVVFPSILVVAAVTTYQLVGRALRPVEAIRAEVAEISRSGVARRVPVADTDDEIATLAVTMNEMLDALAFAREQQIRFVGDSSHELRSPLVTILGLLELAVRTGEPIDSGTVSTLLLPEAHRLRDLVDDLLLLARADESGLRPSLDEVDLDDIVNDEVTRLDLTTDLDISATVLPVRAIGDRDQLGRVVRNLCDNAVRHARSAVAVTMAVEPDRVTVRVADDGPGIPADDRARVFGRFVRLDDSRDRRGGSGLGLSIVDEIVRAHHGTVTVSDTDGGGCSIEVSLPLRADQVDGSPPLSASR